MWYFIHDFKININFFYFVIYSVVARLFKFITHAISVSMKEAVLNDSTPATLRYKLQYNNAKPCVVHASMGDYFFIADVANEADLAPSPINTRITPEKKLSLIHKRWANWYIFNTTQLQPILSDTTSIHTQLHSRQSTSPYLPLPGKQFTLRIRV